MNRKNLLITSALKNELAPIKNNIHTSEYSNLNIHFFISGIGKENVLTRLDKQTKINQFQTIINIGTAGSLSDKFQIGDIVFPSTFLTLLNNTLLKIDFKNLPFIQDNQIEYLNIFTSDSPINDISKKENLKKYAKIVDMESYWISKICAYQNLEFYCIKVISDYAENISMSQFKENLSNYAKLLIKPVKKFLEAYDKC
ncbi:MAG: hypothetical protein JXQ65_06485 [Candidatus Marinimicrobia bacterium]|nr:hypothetical protein [Candidatus Neomarinimicrobiota bacterium]